MDTVPSLQSDAATCELANARLVLADRVTTGGLSMDRLAQPHLNPRPHVGRQEVSGKAIQTGSHPVLPTRSRNEAITLRPPASLRFTTNRDQECVKTFYGE